MNQTKYIIVKEKDITQENLDKIKINKVSPTAITKDDETKTGYYLLKLTSEFPDAFTNYKKLDKVTVLSYVSQIKNGYLPDHEIQHRIEDRDTTGRRIVRLAATQRGWHTQIHSIEVRTASDWYYNHDKNGNDLGFLNIIHLDENGNETTPENGVRTLVDWMPTYDYEIIGGKVTQENKPNADVRFWIEGLPDIMQVPFGEGGINLRKIGQHNEVAIDGRASKYLQYTPYGTNKFRFVFSHPKGLEHDIQILLELYRK